MLCYHYNMINIFTALHNEALPIIDALKLKKDFSIKEFEHFVSDDISLSITGVGGIKAASVLSFIYSRSKDSYFLQIGIAGTRNKEYEIGNIFLINKATQNESKKVFYPDIIFTHNLKENSIESFNRVVTDPSLSLEGELIDMEAAYFLESAQFFSPPHRSQVLKVISDYLDVKNITKTFISKLIEKNLSNISHILEKLQKLLKKEKKEILSNEEIENLNKIFSILNLTEYMKNELFSLYKIKKISLEEILNEIKPPITKSERKKIYERIKQKFI